MSHINLLPWRETLRKQRQKEFGVAAAVAIAFAGLVMALVHFQIEAMISHQEARNSYLQAEIALMDKKIAEIEKLEKTKAQLLARMNIIQKLQQSRPLVVHLFDDLVRTTPEGVVIESLTQQGMKVTLRGIAESNTRVSLMMRNVEASEWLEAPELDVISGSQGRKDDARNVFTLQVAIHQEEEALEQQQQKKGKRK